MLVEVIKSHSSIHAGWRVRKGPIYNVPEATAREKEALGLVRIVEPSVLAARYLKSIECGVFGRHVPDDLKAALTEEGVEWRGAEAKPRAPAKKAAAKK